MTRIWHARFRFGPGRHQPWHSNSPDWWDAFTVFRRLWTESWTSPVALRGYWFEVGQVK